MLYQNADRLFLHLEALDVVLHATHSYWLPKASLGVHSNLSH